MRHGVGGGEDKGRERDKWCIQVKYNKHRVYRILMQLLCSCTKPTCVQSVPHNAMEILSSLLVQ